MSLFASAAMKLKSQMCGLTLAPVKYYTVLTLRLRPFILHISFSVATMVQLEHKHKFEIYILGQGGFCFFVGLCPFRNGTSVLVFRDNNIARSLLRMQDGMRWKQNLGLCPTPLSHVPLKDA